MSKRTMGQVVAVVRSRERYLEVLVAGEVDGMGGS